MSMLSTTWDLVEVRENLGDTYRMQVAGGWLYRVRESANVGPPGHSPVAVSITFVADHGWLN